MGRRALPGLIGVHAAAHAPHDGQTEDGTKGRIEAQRAADDQPQHGRHLGDVEQDDDQRNADVGDGHEGHGSRRKTRDTLEPAEDDEAHQQRQRGGGVSGVHAEGCLHAVGNGIGLHPRQQQTAGDDGDEREHPGVALHAQAFLDVEGRTAAILTVDLFLVDLAQRGLHEG